MQLHFIIVQSKKLYRDIYTQVRCNKTSKNIFEDIIFIAHTLRLNLTGTSLQGWRSAAATLTAAATAAASLAATATAATASATAASPFAPATATTATALSTLVSVELRQM